jgi:streptogramin lyase
MRPLTSLFLFSLFLLCAIRSVAQPVPIGHWRNHLPCLPGKAVVTGNGKVFCASTYSLFSVEEEDHSITRYDKTSGLHDMGISAVNFDPATQVLLIAYLNSNLDILKDGRIYNLPDIFRKPLSGNKAIYQITFYNHFAYLSTGIGIVVVNLDKLEIADTWLPGNEGAVVPVTSLTQHNGYFYVTTPQGIKRGPIQGANLANYQNWTLVAQGLPDGVVEQVVNLHNQLLCRQANNLWIWQNNEWQPWYTDGWQITGMTVADNQLLLCENQQTPLAARVLELGPDASVLRTLQHPQITYPLQASIQDQNIWVADSLNGLILFDGNSYENMTPNAPRSIATGEMLFANNALWVTAGSVNKQWQATGNKNGYYRFEKEEWHNYNSRQYPYLDSLPDLVTLTADPIKGGMYIGSFGGGLLALSSDGTPMVYKQQVLSPALDNPQAYRISGLCADPAGNIWMAAHGANRELLVKKTDQSWQSFFIPFYHIGNAVSQVLTDDYHQVWMVAPNGNGLFVFNYGSSIENTADDNWLQLRMGASHGNLPDDNVNCLAKDLDGYIWVGTNRGIGIFQCAQNLFSASSCTAFLPVVQQDNFAGYLFQNEQVNAITVDGANRKWVATQNGVWLISPNGQKVISRFNTDNSPLPDNQVHKIAIDPISGEVFFATHKGLVSYRGTATTASTTATDSVLVFPNPVPSGYGGMIAIKGLIQNAVVKITDMSGKLVFQTRSAGGLAIWNGLDYTGHRPQSGVYLVFATNSAGQEKVVTKLIFFH